MDKTPYNCGEESLAIPILPLAVHLAFEMADYILKDDPSLYNDQLSYEDLLKERDRWLAKYQEQTEGTFNTLWEIKSTILSTYMDFILFTG